MGTKSAPSIANLVMGDFESKHVYTYPKQPFTWFRFIDDIFIIWTHGRAELDKFVTHLNQVHPTLKFTCTSSTTQVSFLGTLVIKEGHTIHTDLYVKPTDTHMYLHYGSCQPTHTKTGGPYGQLLRVRRICTKLSDFQKHAVDIIHHYAKQAIQSCY